MRPWIAVPPLLLAVLLARAPATVAAAVPPAEPTAPLFREARGDSAVRLRHEHGDRGRRELMAITGPGGALFDYDLDGDLDLYLVAGGPLPIDPPAAVPRGRLLRNDLTVDGDGRVAPRWVDVSERAGLAPTRHGIGVAVGDVDGDGVADLFLADLDGDRLWRNRGDGSFHADAPGALPDGGGWSIGGSFFDPDGDGDLDLYVVRYVVATAGVRCFSETTRRDYCGPAAYPPLADRLLRNRGDGSFEDVSVVSGVAAVSAPGLGVVAGDFDGDARPDLYVANDGQPNLFWRNRGNGSFLDDAAFAGLALSREGLPQAGMGVDAGDADGDGDEDLFVTNLKGETNTLYQNQGEALFEDRTAESGLAAPSLPWTGFGTAFLDADLDGWLDLVVVNGAVRLANLADGAVGSGGAGDPAAHLAALGQPGQLYRNRGGGRFDSDPEAAGPLAEPVVGRGLAVGDVDGDGDLDAVVVANGDAPRLLLGEPPAGSRWLGVAPCPFSAEAAWLARRVVVRTAPVAGAAALPPLHRRPHRDGSYASSRDPRVVVGLGTAGAASELEIAAAGHRLRWLRPPAGRYLTWCAP